MYGSLLPRDIIAIRSPSDNCIEHHEEGPRSESPRAHLSCMMTKSIATFLAYLKDVYTKQLRKSNAMRVVCGNQSADFDSVMSALTYAYCSYQNNPEEPLIPIIGIPKQELSLRRDVTRALAKAYVEEDHLFFLEDLKSFKEKSGSIKAVLVDHNEIESGVKKYLDEVIGVIDHHKDQGLYSNVKPRIVRTTGSCSSLVINYWTEKIADISSIREVALLCLGAGVIDTSNFTSKVEDPDRKASQLYNKLFPDLDIASLYKQIRHDKDDLDGLSIEEILKKDYKEFDFKFSDGTHNVKVGIASTVKPLSWFYQSFGGEPVFQEKCYKVQRQEGVDIFIVMTASMDGSEFKRELVVLSDAQEVCQNIVSHISKELNLEDTNSTIMNSKGQGYFKAFKQKNVSASRKQVAPFIKDAIQKS